MKITWTLTQGILPGAKPAPDFMAFDGKNAIGRVYQIENGPDRGLWLWAMAAIPPGASTPHIVNGRAAEGGKAGRCLLQAYRDFSAQFTQQACAMPKRSSAN